MCLKSNKPIKCDYANMKDKKSDLQGRLCPSDLVCLSEPRMGLAECVMNKANQ